MWLWSSGTSWSPGLEHSTEWSPASWRFDPRPSSFHGNSRKSVPSDGQSSCPSPAPQSWFQSLLGGSCCAVVSPERASVGGRWQKETREWLLVRDGVNGPDHVAESAGEEKASCLLRCRGTDRSDSEPEVEKGPLPQRPAGSDPGGRWSIRLSSSLMEPLLPEEAAALKWEWTAGQRCWLWILHLCRTRSGQMWPGSPGCSWRAGSSTWSGFQWFLQELSQIWHKMSLPR